MEVNDAVLCILHLELRASENKLAHMWNEGFAYRKSKALVEEYAKGMELIVNEGKIGRTTYQNQWQFPINKTNDGITSDFSLKGGFGKSILSKSDRLIDVALKYHTQQERNDWNLVLEDYQDALQFINRRTEFKKGDVQESQAVADRYANSWRELCGRDGQTNYEHFLLTGHVSHYLTLYGNLYRFSQQGFEAMMSRVKCIYHKCTALGGHGAVIRSHILQICHFLVRGMLWNSGHSKAYFEAKYGLNNNIDLFNN